MDILGWGGGVCAVCLVGDTFFAVVGEGEGTRSGCRYFVVHNLG